MVLATGETSVARILVVDDDKILSRLLQNLLASSGHVVALATSGGQALELSATEPPDLILLDVLLPEMDGFETCRRFKANDATAHVPVVLMTISNDLRLNSKAFIAGATFTMTKPFSPGRLANIVNLALAPDSPREADGQRSRGGNLSAR